MEHPGLSVENYLEDLDVWTVCRVFIDLVCQLPLGTTIHCILDSISQFETVIGNWVEDLRIVIDCLQWCVANLETSAGLCMKSLFSSADASTRVRDLVPSEQQVDLSSGVYYGFVPTLGALITELSTQLSTSDPSTLDDDS